MSYIVLDLEFNQCFDFVANKTINKIPSCRFEIIQIGAVKLDEKFNLVDKISLYIKPNLYKKMHPYVQKITGLTSEFLNDKQTFKEAYKKFNEFSKCDNPIYCVWGSSDLRALYRNLTYYKLIEFPMIVKYIDVQKLTSEYLKYSKGNNIGLKNAIEILDLEINEEFHDALNDASYTADILRKIGNTNTTIKVFNSKNVPNK